MSAELYARPARELAAQHVAAGAPNDELTVVLHPESVRALLRLHELPDADTMPLEGSRLWGLPIVPDEREPLGTVAVRWTRRSVLPVIPPNAGGEHVQPCHACTNPGHPENRGHTLRGDCAGA